MTEDERRGPLRGRSRSRKRASALRPIGRLRTSVEDPYRRYGEEGIGDLFSCCSRGHRFGGVRRRRRDAAGAAREAARPADPDARLRRRRDVLTRRIRELTAELERVKEMLPDES